ncbi:Inner membrane protein YhaI [compost metagenome]
MDYIIGATILAGLYSLAILLPSLALVVRRLHDTGRSGWWVLIGFIPLIGFIVLLVFMCTDSDPDTNQYGPNPKYE